MRGRRKPNLLWKSCAEACGPPRVVRTLDADGKVLPAPMGVIENAHDAHDRKAAAGLLRRGLRVDRLVLNRVIELHGASVQRFDHQALVFVLLADAGVGPVIGPLPDELQQAQLDPVARLAVGARVGAWTLQAGVRAPRLHQADRLGTRCVGLEDLRQPSPENRHVVVVTLAFRGRVPVKEIGGQDVAELHRVGGDGGICQRLAPGCENGLKAAADPATDRGGES